MPSSSVGRGAWVGRCSFGGLWAEAFGLLGAGSFDGAVSVKQVEQASGQDCDGLIGFAPCLDAQEDRPLVHVQPLHERVHAADERGYDLAGQGAALDGAGGHFRFSGCFGLVHFTGQKSADLRAMLAYRVDCDLDRGNAVADQGMYIGFAFRSS